MENSYDFRSESNEDNENLNKDNSELSNENNAVAPRETFYHSISTPEKKEGQDRYYEIFDKNKPKTMGWSVVSLVLSVISVICCFLGWGGLIIGVLAIAFALVSRFNLGYFDTMSVIGLIAGIFGVVFGAVVMIWEIIVEANMLMALSVCL